jgi:acyl phosphate:glycerol-3-phosphate acyltransferase
MTDPILSFLAIVAAYLLGSVSFAVLVSKFSGLADPRSYGSGNPGATNVLRTGNKKAAVFTLLGDALKGTFAVVIAQQCDLVDVVVNLVGLAAFAGHIYPVFLKFKGGKGVATGAGVLLALSPVMGLCVLLTWLAVAYFSRYSSLAAILAALSAPVWAWLFHGMSVLTLTVALIGSVLIAKHRANISRLLAGQESKIGNQKK